MIFVLSNKYIEAIIQSLESIFNEKVEGLFYKIKMIKNKILTFSLNILGLHRMITSECLFEKLGYKQIYWSAS